MNVYSHGCHKERHRIKLTKIRRICETCVIFFGSDQNFVLVRDGLKALEQLLDVIATETVMVRKTHFVGVEPGLSQMGEQWCWIGNACEA